MKKAIMFTAYNRVDYLKDSLESWTKVNNLKDYDIYFKVEPSDVNQEIMDVISDFNNKVESKVLIIQNPIKLGNGYNTWSGFNKLFNDYEFVILAEDDILVSRDIIDYFNYLEEKYRDEHEVSIISANTKGELTDPSKVTRDSVFNGLIWGTWASYWKDYFANTWDKDYTSGDPAGWDWNLTLRVLPANNLKVIHPYTSRSQHIGLDGLHCTPEIFHITQSPTFKENFEWTELTE